MSSIIKRHVVVVDDDADMRDVLEDTLNENGYRTTTVSDGQAMWHVLNGEICDLLVLDLRLNNENGLQLAREVRQKSTIPIMMLTGQGDEMDRILGLELAADDFLMKPFNVRELVARVRALIRRSTELNHTFCEPVEAEHDYLAFGDWVLDMTRRELRKASGNQVALTFGEYQLLEILAKSPDRVFSREQLLNQTRLESTVFDRTIDVLILRLRRKIEPNPKQPQYILTERGMGYLFCGPVKSK